MKLGLMVLMTAAFGLWPYAAQACRHPVEPSDLVEQEADGIALVRIAEVANHDSNGGPRWTTKATQLAHLYGGQNRHSLEFRDPGPGSCGPWRPVVGSEWVFYVRKVNGTPMVTAAWPFWFARRSEDRRLVRLHQLRPLGTARPPSGIEAPIVARFEEKARAELGSRDLSRYTRVYSRTSPTSFAVELVPSRTPRRLYVSPREAGPTPESCRCKLTTIFVDAADMKQEIATLSAHER